MGFDMTSDNNDNNRPSFHRPSTAVQILAIICFTGFAIPVSIVAMGEFGVLGLALAAFLGWQWTRLAGFGSNTGVAETVQRLKPQVDAPETTSGNASFDSYRDDLMGRLEREQTEFDGFLGRLRDAKDKTEFDTFLEDRARIYDASEPRNSAPA